MLFYGTVTQYNVQAEQKCFSECEATKFVWANNLSAHRSSRAHRVAVLPSPAAVDIKSTAPFFIVDQCWMVKQAQSALYTFNQQTSSMGRIYHGAVVASDVTAIDHDKRLGMQSQRDRATRYVS